MTTPILEARGLSRSFGHVQALETADFDIKPGEVVALIGDNGAGKSTMVKALSGNLEVDSGELLFEGRAGADHQPAAGVRAGHGGRLPGPRAGAAPEPGAEHVPRPGDPPQGHPRPRWGSWTRRPCGPAGRGRLRRTRRHGAVVHRAGRRRCPAASASRSPSPGPSAWADKVVFLDEPTAALGVVQTKNVLETHQAGPGQGHRRGPDLSLDAARAGGRRPGPGACGWARGSPHTAPKTHGGGARRRHDRRPRQAEGAAA